MNSATILPLPLSDDLETQDATRSPAASPHPPGQPFRSLGSFPSFSSAASRARVGKIARLPEPVREALNQRLHEGQPARIILPWLNGLPETRDLTERLFGGQAINEPNLSAWR